MSPTLIVLIVQTVFQADTIIKDTVHGVKVARHVLKHPKKTASHPIQTAKEVSK